MKWIKNIVVAIVAIALFSPLFSNAQSVFSPSFWKELSNILQPTNSNWKLQIPSLGSSGNPCVTIANASGTFATSTCGSGGSGSSTNVFGVSPIVVSALLNGNQTSSCPTCIATNTGNWAGTWQLYNHSDFKASSTASLSTSSAISVSNFPFWTAITGSLSGTSTLTQSGGNINASGTITQNGTAVLTGNQTVTLTGPVTGSGATSIATTITSPLIVSDAQHTTIEATTSITDAGTLQVTGALTASSTLTATNGLVSLASTTINGQATTTNLSVTNQVGIPWNVMATSTTSTTIITFGGTSERQMITITTSTNITISGTQNGWSDQAKICQDTVGSRLALTWAVSGTNNSTTLAWGTAGTPTLSTGVSKCDFFTFVTSPLATNNASNSVAGFYGQNGFQN